MSNKINQTAWWDYWAFETEKFKLLPMNSSTKPETAIWIEREDGEGTEISVDTLNNWLEKMFDEVM